MFPVTICSSSLLPRKIENPTHWTCCNLLSHPGTLWGQSHPEDFVPARVHHSTVKHDRCKDDKETNTVVLCTTRSWGSHHEVFHRLRTMWNGLAMSLILYLQLEIWIFATRKDLARMYFGSPGMWDITDWSNSTRESHSRWKPQDFRGRWNKIMVWNTIKWSLIKYRQ